MFLAWTPAAIPTEAAGPWQELRPAADGLAFLDSDDTLSAVYHALKWSLPEGTALIVVPVLALPKLKGLPAGTTTWLRDRLAR